MRRVKFKDNKQKEFLKEVLIKIHCPSLIELINRGFDINYSTLKNYFSGKRLLPEDLFKNLCYISKISPSSLKIEYIKENWGQIKGGKKSKK